jgi:hypothetical protein
MTVVMNPSSERSGAMIRKETHGRVAVIRIERPAKRNAIDRVTTGEPAATCGPTQFSDCSESAIWLAERSGRWSH